MPLPRDEEKAKPHGLLTYTLCQLLTPRSAAPQKPLTYRELAEQVRQQYATDDRISPTPLIEGGELDREVLGVNEWPSRSRIVLSKTRDGSWQINAGVLLGINAGSILAVHEPRSATGKPAGYVEVKSPGMAVSAVVPREFEGTAKNEQLATGSRCELAYLNFGARPLKLSVVDASSTAPRNNLATLELLRRTANSLAQRTGSLVQMENDPQSANWLLELRDQQCVLIPRQVIMQHNDETSEAALAGQVIGPFDSLPTTYYRCCRAS